MANTYSKLAKVIPGLEKAAVRTGDAVVDAENMQKLVNVEPLMMKKKTNAERAAALAQPILSGDDYKAKIAAKLQERALKKQAQQEAQEAIKASPRLKSDVLGDQLDEATASGISAQTDFDAGIKQQQMNRALMSEERAALQRKSKLEEMLKNRK